MFNGFKFARLSGYKVVDKKGFTSTIGLGTLGNRLNLDHTPERMASHTGLFNSSVTPQQVLQVYNRCFRSVQNGRRGALSCLLMRAFVIAFTECLKRRHIPVRFAQSCTVKQPPLLISQPPAKSQVMYSTALRKGPLLEERTLFSGTPKGPSLAQVSGAKYTGHARLKRSANSEYQAILCDGDSTLR